MWFYLHVSQFCVACSQNCRASVLCLLYSSCFFSWRWDIFIFVFKGFFFKRTYYLYFSLFLWVYRRDEGLFLTVLGRPARNQNKEDRGETGTEESQKRLYLHYWRQKRERELENKVVEETRRQGFIYTPTKWQAHTQWHRDLYIYLPGRRPSSCTSRSLVFS